MTYTFDVNLSPVSLSLLPHQTEVDRSIQSSRPRNFSMVVTNTYIVINIDKQKLQPVKFSQEAIIVLNLMIRYFRGPISH